MPLTLKTITLNHDPNSASTSAMNIRKNKDFEVPIPEYDASIPRTPAESCAAYARLETANQQVTVRVNFEIPNPANISYEVRAAGGGVLGSLNPVTVTFMNMASATVNISLSGRDFSKVVRQDITWQWQYRQLGNLNWQGLATTSHRIYVILAVPSSPWTQAFSDKRNPWTDLLDECCMTTSGSDSDKAAVVKLAQKIHLAYSLRYDIVQGAPRYGFGGIGGSFELTNWIDYVLKGNAPLNPKFCPGLRLRRSACSDGEMRWGAE